MAAIGNQNNMNNLNLKVKKARSRGKNVVIWTTTKTAILLNLVKKTAESFEKPNASIYYEKIIGSSMMLKDMQWTHLRDKMKNLKKSYKDAIDWRDSTGAGLLEDDDEASVEEYILKLCPNFKELQEIYGNRASVNIPVICDTAADDSDCVVEYLEEEEETKQTIKKRMMAGKIKGADRPTGNSSLSFLVEAQKERNELLKMKMQKDLQLEEQRIQLEKEKIEVEKERIKAQKDIRKMELEDQMKLEQWKYEQELKFKYALMEKNSK